MATPVASLSGEDLVRRREATLGATLNGLPGVHFDHFGAGASRPVIRGQTAPRVKILSDGSEVYDASAISPAHPNEHGSAAGRERVRQKVSISGVGESIK